MARNLIIELIGVDRFTPMLDTAVGGMSRLGEASKLAGLAVVAGVAVGLEKSVKAAARAQEEQGKLDTAFGNAGKSAKQLAPFVGHVEAANRKLGFSNNETRDSLTKLVTAGD